MNEDNPRLMTFAECQQRYAGGGGGSFDAANMCRVDALGSDETGTVGDMTKPFLTVQAAIDALVALASGILGVIEIGANDFEEDLTITEQIILMFKGAGSDGTSNLSPLIILCQTLTLTAPATIYVKDCTLATSTIITSDDLDLVLENVNINGATIESTAATDKHLTVISPTNTAYGFSLIRADDISTLNVVGLMPQSGGGDVEIDNSSANVLIKNCGHQSTDSIDEAFDMGFGGSVGLDLINTVCRNISAPTGTVTAIDSRISGTVTAASYSNDRGGYDFNYDFARDGGTGTIVLSTSLGSQPAFGLPVGLIVTGAKLEVITPLDSASHLAHVAMTTGETAADLQSATLVSAPPWSTAHLAALTILEKMTGANQPAIVITTEDLTAGKFNLHIDGYLSA